MATQANDDQHGANTPRFLDDRAGWGAQRDANGPGDGLTGCGGERGTDLLFLLRVHPGADNRVAHGERDVERWRNGR